MSPQHRIARPMPARRPALRPGPVEPGRHRLDFDRIVGIACAALLPFVLWLARY